MAQWDISLPEMSVENFDCSWAWFELVIKEKEWNNAKQLMVIPTLLLSKLLNWYLDQRDEERSSMEELKKLLVRRASLCADPLAPAKKFMTRSQETTESISDKLVWSRVWTLLFFCRVHYRFVCPYLPVATFDGTPRHCSNSCQISSIDWECAGFLCQGKSASSHPHGSAEGWIKCTSAGNC